MKISISISADTFKKGEHVLVKQGFSPKEYWVKGVIAGEFYDKFTVDLLEPNEYGNYGSTISSLDQLKKIKQVAVVDKYKPRKIPIPKGKELTPKTIQYMKEFLAGVSIHSDAVYKKAIKTAGAIFNRGGVLYRGFPVDSLTDVEIEKYISLIKEGKFRMKSTEAMMPGFSFWSYDKGISEQYGGKNSFLFKVKVTPKDVILNIDDLTWAYPECHPEWQPNQKADTHNGESEVLLSTDYINFIEVIRIFAGKRNKII